MAVVHELLARKRKVLSRTKPALSDTNAVTQPIAASVGLRGSQRSLSFRGVHQHGVVQDGAGDPFADAKSRPSAEPRLPLSMAITFMDASRSIVKCEVTSARFCRGTVASSKPSLPLTIKVPFSTLLCVCLETPVKGALI